MLSIAASPWQRPKSRFGWSAPCVNIGQKRKEKAKNYPGLG